MNDVNGRITVRREYRGYALEAAVQYHPENGARRISDASLEAVAAGGAWRSLCGMYIGDELWNDAVRCAQQGLEELGSPYERPDLIDDTDLKIMVAGELAKQGRIRDAALLLERMLELRLQMSSASLGVGIQIEFRNVHSEPEVEIQIEPKNLHSEPEEAL